MRKTRDERRETSERDRTVSSLDSRHSTLGSPTFLFAGGGSGGHLFPGIAVAEELRLRGPMSRSVFAGSERGIEGTVLGGHGWRKISLPVLPPNAAGTQPVRFLGGLARSIRVACRLLDELRPVAVVGLGGFASVPCGIAARLRGVPLVLLEQNIVPGRATTFLSRWADRVCVGFEETAAFLPRGASVRFTGNPVRMSVRRASKGSSSSDRSTLLVLGGSQGAVGVNEMAVAAAASLRERLTEWRIVHQAGERDRAAVRDEYEAAGIEAEVAAFFDDLPGRYQDATLVVSRAGATTLAELACVGRPVVLVPYPRSVRDHQQRNAERFAAEGAAVIVPEGRGASGRLADVLSQLLGDSDRLAEMSAAMRRLAKPSAAEAVADLLLPQSAAAKAA